MRASSLSVHVLSILSIQLTCIFAHAQTTLTPISAASAALGGAGRAAVEPIDVHGMNPATLVHLRNRDVHVTGGTRDWLVGLTDNSIDNLFAGALSYSQSESGKNESLLRHEEVRLSLAGFVTEKISVGTTIKQVTSKADPARWMQNNADLGFSFVPREDLGFALVLSDLMSSSLEDEDPVRLRPRTAFAVHGILNPFVGLRADLVSGEDHDFSQRALLLGYEGALNEWVALRLGWGENKEAMTEFATGGVGLRLPRFRVNLAHQVPIRGEFEHRLALDLGVPF